MIVSLSQPFFPNKLVGSRTYAPLNVHIIHTNFYLLDCIRDSSSNPIRIPLNLNQKPIYKAFIIIRKHDLLRKLKTFKNNRFCVKKEQKEKNSLKTYLMKGELKL